MREGHQTYFAIWAKVDMVGQFRWDPCVAHHQDDVRPFMRDYFGSTERKTLLIAGAGFDPRSRAVARELGAVDRGLTAIFIKEERPEPEQELVDRAAANASELASLIPSSRFLPVEVLGPDEAVVGGRNVITLVHGQSYKGFSDVVVDLSALSIGISFPIVRYFFERTQRGDGPKNLHVLVCHDPSIDAGINSEAGDTPGYVHGFIGGSTLSKAARAAKLWLPQLAIGRNKALGRLFDFVDPHDTCPILPFPAKNPRAGDDLVEAFMTEFESTWQVDASNIVYADEGDPLDLYRTILRLDDIRKLVFKETGGSLLVLSPLGSKLMALGALMAALERDLPVAYLEAIGYNLAPTVPEDSETLDLVHVWLEGDAYSQPRPKLFSGGSGS